MKAFATAATLASFACGPTGGQTAPGRSNTVVVGVQGPGRVLSIPPGIDCPGICAVTFAVGTTVTLAAVPADDGLFREWSGDCAGATGCELSVTNGAAIVAGFEAR